MRKIKLEVEALTVESFEAGTTTPTPRGTVHANRFEQLRDDIPHDASGLACATGGYNYCAAETYGCVEYSDCWYGVTQLC